MTTTKTAKTCPNCTKRGGYTIVCRDCQRRNRDRLGRTARERDQELVTGRQVRGHEK